MGSHFVLSDSEDFTCLSFSVWYSTALVWMRLECNCPWIVEAFGKYVLQSSIHVGFSDLQRAPKLRMICSMHYDQFKRSMSSIRLDCEKDNLIFVIELSFPQTPQERLEFALASRRNFFHGTCSKPLATF